MASSRRDLRTRHKRELWVNTAVVTAISLYIGLQFGATCAETGQHNILAALGDVLGHMAEHPFKLFPCWWPVVAVSAFFPLLAFLYFYSDYMRRCSTMFRDAHGSGGFNDDLRGFYKEYVLDPALVKGKCARNQENKKVTRKKDYLTGKNGKLAEISYGVHRLLMPGRVLSREELRRCLGAAKILSKEVYLSTNAVWTRRNLNCFVLGASGTGKSRFIVKPNILQANSSYVVTDPSGEILKDCGGFLKSQGYQIKVLNLKDLGQSCRYNPMAYLGKPADIPVLINCMMSNIGGQDKGGGGNEKFWTQSTLALMSACTAYLFEVFTEENEYLDEAGHYPNPYWTGHRNFVNVMRMLRMAEIHEDEGATISDLDRLFAEQAEKNHNSYAVRMYQTFKMAPDKTALNILISTAVELGTFFDNDDFTNLAYRDEMDIPSIGRRKTAVFIILPEGETTYNFFASMFYTQLFQILYAQGEDNATRTHGDPALEIPCQIFLDEMANIGKIPEFNTKLATMRKYGISCTLIFQSQSQTKEYSEKGWESMIGNCDTLIYLGGAEPSTVKMLSERLGKETVQTFSYGASYGGKGGSSDNRQQIGRNVLDTNEIEQMQNNEQLIFIRGVRPFCVEKYPYEEHPNYKYSAGSHEKEAVFYDPSEFNISFDEDEVARTFVYIYGDRRHTEPRMLQKYEGRELPIDNFSRKLDARCRQLTGDKNAAWRQVEGAADMAGDGGYAGGSAYGNPYGGGQTGSGHTGGNQNSGSQTGGNQNSGSQAGGQSGGNKPGGGHSSGGQSGGMQNGRGLSGTGQDAGSRSGEVRSGEWNDGSGSVEAAGAVAGYGRRERTGRLLKEGIVSADGRRGSSLENLNPVNAADQADIRRKLENLRMGRCRNLTQEDYKRMINLETDEELAAYCRENWVFVDAYSAAYEFEE